MKSILAAALVATSMLIAGAAHASADLANANCGKCHDMDKKKKGPSYKTIAAKFKGKDAELLKAFTDPNGDHPEVKVKPDDQKAIAKWLASM